METISPISRARPASSSMTLARAGSRGFTRGFTFVELIFIIALITIITAVSIPQFKRSFDSLVLQNFISDFTALAGYAQAKAVSSGSEVRVNLDLPQKRFLIEDRLESQGAYGESEVEWEAGKEKRIPDSVLVDLKESADKIVFYPDGSSDKAEFEVSGRYNKKYLVSVEPGTGCVNVKETE